MNFLVGLEEVSKGAALMVTWALAMLGGSIALIVSTSYLRPKNLAMRLTYLLFLPGWIFLGLSIYYGDKISRRYMAAKLVSQDNLEQIAKLISQNFGCQRLWLWMGLIIFGVWLFLFLLWWVFGEWTVSGQNNGG